MLRLMLIFLLFIVALVMLMQLLTKYNLVSYKMRVGVGIALIVLAIGIGIFTLQQDKNAAYLTQLTQSFLQGETLFCERNANLLEVNNKSFNFISGTLTLMGKDDSKHKRVIIPLKACKNARDS